MFLTAFSHTVITSCRLEWYQTVRAYYHSNAKRKRKIGPIGLAPRIRQTRSEGW
jgi:hypothetical protein